MKGDEGWFLVIVLVNACISDVYADRMKGEGLFSFRFSNFRFCSISRYFGIKIWGFFWYLAKKIWGFFLYLVKKIWGFFCFLTKKIWGFRINIVNLHPSNRIDYGKSF